MRKLAALQRRKWRRCVLSASVFLTGAESDLSTGSTARVTPSNTSAMSASNQQSFMRSWALLRFFITIQISSLQEGLPEVVHGRMMACQGRE